jgi:hypothetical protein
MNNGKRSRALHPFDEEDRCMLAAISGGEFIINGFRNKDLQPLLYTSKAPTIEETRRRSAPLAGNCAF